MEIFIGNNMEIKQILHKLNHYILNHLKTYTIIFSVLLVIIIGIFLYYNFYQTIISTKEIIILQEDIAPATINIELLNKVEKTFQSKQVKTNFDWKQYNKIFNSLDNPLPADSTLENNIQPQTNF
jgi:hypothetical protein